MALLTVHVHLSRMYEYVRAHLPALKGWALAAVLSGVTAATHPQNTWGVKEVVLLHAHAHAHMYSVRLGTYPRV